MQKHLCVNNVIPLSITSLWAVPKNAYGRLQMIVWVADLVAKIRGRLQTVVWVAYLAAEIRGRLQTVVWFTIWAANYAVVL